MIYRLNVDFENLPQDFSGLLIVPATYVTKESTKEVTEEDTYKLLEKLLAVTSNKVSHDLLAMVPREHEINQPEASLLGGLENLVKRSTPTPTSIQEVIRLFNAKAKYNDWVMIEQLSTGDTNKLTAMFEKFPNVEDWELIMKGLELHWSSRATRISRRPTITNNVVKKGMAEILYSIGKNGNVNSGRMNNVEVADIYNEYAKVNGWPVVMALTSQRLTAIKTASKLLDTTEKWKILLDYWQTDDYFSGRKSSASYGRFNMTFDKLFEKGRYASFYERAIANNEEQTEKDSFLDDFIKGAEAAFAKDREAILGVN